MKYFILLATVLMATLQACDQELDLYPKDRLTPETFFNNEDEVRLYTNSFYTMFPSASSVYGQSADDIVVSVLPLETTGQRTIPETGGGWSFGSLRDINFYLENSNRVKDLDVKQRYDALARFFRAFFYFEKVKRFGDVPWYNKVLDSNDPDLYKPRDSRILVMDSVLRDIDFAIEYLPEKKHLYRVTRWTALALKSRICLFEGTFRKYHNISGYERFLNECVLASEIFMNESGYSLYKQGAEPYKDLFASLDAKEEEIILAIRYDIDLSLYHNVQNYLTSGGMGKPGVTKKIVDSYLMASGERFTDLPNYKSLEFYDECQNRDPRLSQTIRTPGYTRKGSSTMLAPNFASTTTGYQLIKYALESFYDDWNKSHCDIPLFRTAEVYLNFVEAKAEAESITQDDVDKTINLLRDRVGMPSLNLPFANANPDPYLLSPETGYPNVSTNNQGIILEIRRERTIELMMEGFRYYDLMRWKEGKAFEKDFLGMYIPAPGIYNLDQKGSADVCFYTGDRPDAFVPLFLKLGEEINLVNGEEGNIIVHGSISRRWDEERDYLYPIPTQDRILSEGYVIQNPGWDDGLTF